MLINLGQTGARHILLEAWKIHRKLNSKSKQLQISNIFYFIMRQSMTWAYKTFKQGTKLLKIIFRHRMRLDKSCSAQLQATRGPGLRKCRSSTPLYRHNSMAIRIWEAGEVTIKFQPGLTWGMDGPRNVFFLLHSTVTISDAPNHRINIFSLGSCPLS